MLDRALVRPNDTLHITGYLQQLGKGGLLGLPLNVTQARVRVQPSWDPDRPDEPVM